MSPSVAIGFLPRERFSMGAESLQSVLDNTTVDFELVVVHPGTPDRYRKEVDDLLRGRSNVRTIALDRFLLPAAARNLVVAATDSDYVCLVENDMLVGEENVPPLVLLHVTTLPEVPTGFPNASAS